MHQTSLFQGNPARFDLDGFFATRPATLSWIVTRYSDQVAIGDQVFLWRAIGSDKRAQSGIIAEAEIMDPPSPRLDDAASIPFWKMAEDAASVMDRATLRLIRVASKREVIRREWLQEDPILRDLAILKMANATNYKLTQDHAARLNVMWAMTGRDWSYAESVAGLWAYHQTHGKEISKLLGSPVAIVALLTGRAIGGVYNKVMNFRAIDPRDQRAGMSGAGGTDRQVWAKFYEPAAHSLQTDALLAEFDRLWGNVSAGFPPDEAEARESTIREEAEKLSRLSLSELLLRYEMESRNRPKKPKVRTATASVYDRDPLVIAIAKGRANFRCEVPGCAHVHFISPDGIPYCEVHHIHPLAKGGADTPNNVACLCPSHHREAHHGEDAAKLLEALLAIRVAPASGPNA